MIKILSALPTHDDRSGDVYAVRSDRLGKLSDVDDQAGD
jgi:hypothetical protein